MDSKIEKLLDKYWAAEASLEEERELKTLLAETSQEEETEELVGLFDHFEEEKSITLGSDFDQEILAMIEAEPEAKVVSFADYFKRYASIAAAVLVLLVSSYAFIQNQNTYTQEDTYDSPEAALQEIKKQLLTVSLYMNKGNKQINELNNLGKMGTGLDNLSQLNQAGVVMQSLENMDINR